MALVCSTSNTDHRIYGPSNGFRCPTRGEQAECKSRLLAKIHGVYCKALERLTAVKARRPHDVAAARVLHGGALCFGLVDPVSNIIANTFISYNNYNGGGKGSDAAAELEELERRSLIGLVTFLTRFFPYLADCEAVSYLVVAGADALVAARIIVRDRRMTRFGSSELAVEEAVEMALKCAALAAGHPDPDRLVGAWLSISGRLDDAVELLGKVRRRCPSSSFRNLGSWLLLDGARRRPPPVNNNSNSCRSNLWRPWKLAASRRPHPRLRVQPHQSISTIPLQHVLLDAIHGFYLAALARLPAGELRSRFHRSMLVAGHCYGPLDPVSNIIVNTVWFDAAFPRTHELELDLVSTLSLHRVGTRSMYGLVSFLCTRYHRPDFRHAVRLLVESDANLLLADPNLDGAAAAAVLRKEERRRRSNSPWSIATSSSHNALGVLVTGVVEDAFKAAAIAARHPNPNAQAKLLASCKHLLGPSLSLLQSGGQLTSADVQRLATLLCPEPPPCIEQPLPPFPLKEYLRVHTRIVDKVVAALNACALTYELHVVCGVNENVSGPVYCPGGSRFAPHKCYRSHVNFLAAPRGTDQAPILFFAELNNDDDGATNIGTLPCFCCLVPLPAAPPPCAERVRCLYCDYAGIRIVHPIGTSFHGHEMEFEKMVCGEDPCDEDFNPALMHAYYTNTDIIRHSRLVADGIYNLKEDCLYVGGCGFDGQMGDDNDEEDDQDVVYGDDYDVYE